MEGNRGDDVPSIVEGALEAEGNDCVVGCLRGAFDCSEEYFRHLASEFVNDGLSGLELVFALLAEDACGC